MSRNIWKTLGIAATNDATEIKHAYARRLKQVHPEDDPEGFQALREAYDNATRMARNGWAAPQPAAPTAASGATLQHAEDGDEADAGTWPADTVDRWSREELVHGDWSDDAIDRWRRPETELPPGGWSGDERSGRWSQASPEPGPADEPAGADDIRAELARERQRSEAHRALCDALADIISNPDGDRQEALAAMLRVLRSPGMDSLDAHARTERWLAHIVTVGGPVVEDMVEPLIHYFDWNSRPIGVDLSHAMPVLQRRDAGIAIRRLERKSDPNHQAWRSLRDKPGRLTRLRARLIPGLTARVLALLDRIERELPEAARHMNPEAVDWWRARQSTPGLDALFLWILALAPVLLGGAVTVSGTFGPPAWIDFLALWTVLTSALLGGGLLYLHGVVRPRLVWRDLGPWDQPLWRRFGWAAGALVLPLIAGLLPPAASAWGAFALGVAAIGLWGWARVASSHLDQPGRAFDWGRYVSVIPVLGWLLFEAGRIGPAPFCAALGAAVVLQTGCDAIADEIGYLSPARRRGLFLGLLGLVGAAATALFAAGAGIVTLTAAAAVVAATALADRALSWAHESPLFVARRVVLLVGWLGGLILGAMLPFDEDMRLSIGLGLWLLTAALLNAVPTLLQDVWPGRGRSGRKPGALA